MKDLQSRPKMTERINLVIDKGLKNKAYRYAKNKGVSFSELVRYALERIFK